MKHNLLQVHLFLFLLTTSICFAINIIPDVHSRCIKDQQLSLLHLKKSLTFEKHAPTSQVMSWNSSRDCCSWFGVTCGSNGHVVGLDLSSQFISGGIVHNSSTLFDLQHLQNLNLADNLLDCPVMSIPSAIGKLKNLRYLNFSRNGFFDSSPPRNIIPIEVSRLTKLLVLDISHNSGCTIPTFSMLFHNLTHLTELYLDGLDLSTQGTHWCQAISSSLPNLQVLNMSDCRLSGPIHHSLAKLHSLSVIGLDDNNISGSIPGSFANFSKLTSLSLKYCELTGTFPKEIFQLPTLQTIDLSGNEKLYGSLPDFPNINGSLRMLSLRDTNFSGLLPASVGSLKHLSSMDISNCSFSGSIPKSFENLTQLVVLDMSSNRLTGPVNSIHWESLIHLSSLDLGDNLLNGSIPTSIFGLPLLKTLELNENLFSGKLQEFSNISSNLDSIDLSSNDLEGEIPKSFFKIPYIGYLDLSDNRLLLDSGGQSSSSLQILSLRLSSNKLTTFPYFLRNQTELEFLDLSNNHLQGSIPNWIWSLNSLMFLNLSCNSFETLEASLLNSSSSLSVVDLHSNQIQGQFPIFTSNLTVLDFSDNHFSSTIPTNIGHFLAFASFFSLSNNNLHGPIPLSTCKATLLSVLDFSNNSLSGSIPKCFSTAMAELQVLNLRINNLTGRISNFRFPTKCGLELLDLDQNAIEGPLPKSLANCKGLKVLTVKNNHIKDAFPYFLKKTSTLRVLALRSNKLYGQVRCPKSYGIWPVLQIVDLAHNNFNGKIPGEFFTTWRAMIMANETEDDSFLELVVHTSQRIRKSVIRESAILPRSVDGISVISKGYEMNLVKILLAFTLIDFSCNNFNGSIPKELGQFKALHTLNLSGNAFTGKIPSSFGNMQQLESLDLSNNILCGEIPGQLAKLSFLSFLNVSNNQLAGRIPSGTQFSTYPKDSFVGNKGLWGPPLTDVDNKPPTLNGSVQNSGNDDDEINWDVIIVEIGFAFGFGVAIASLVFFKRWRKWYYRAMYKILVKIFPRLEERIGPHRRHVHINQRFGRRG